MEKGRLGKSLYSPGYERFLTELRRARAASGMTQVEAAKRLGRPQSFISNCESGERRVDLIEFLVFCRLYGVDPKQIIDVLENQNPSSHQPRRKHKA